MLKRLYVNNAPVIRILLVTGALFFFIPASRAQFIFNDQCREAYRNIFSLEFRNAEKILALEKKDNPGNLLTLYLENYIDFLTLYIGEEKTDLNHLLPNRSKRIHELEKGTKDSPYYHYCLAEIYLQWAFVRLKFGDMAQAALDVRKAKLLFAENETRFPGFLPNKTGLGVIHIMMGIIPDNYKWITNILGMEGSIEQGFAELRQVAAYSGPDKSFRILKPEASFYLALVATNLSQSKRDAISLLDQLEIQAREERLQQSPLIIFARSNILMKNGLNEEALKILGTRPSFEYSYPFYYLDYLEGLARLNRLDFGANRCFQNYITHFRGQNYIRAANQKLAWISWLKGDTAGYLDRMKRIKITGGNLVDEDKQALHEAISGILPETILLRARLLFDGGYYDLALKELTNNPVKNFVRSRRDLIEYTYRLGRIYHGKHDYDKAIDYYKQTIQRGKHEPYYFSCAAALQLGLIYEAGGQYHQADSAFRVCLSIETPEYKTSLSQKAKAGLNRLKK